MFSNILLTIFAIGLVIFAHESGHFICARLAGVRVNVFSLGFGPRLFGFIKNGCDYRVSLLPLGGYVQVAGEDPTRRDNLKPYELYAKGYLARLFFFSGGVIMNMLFALIAFPLVFNAGVEFTSPVLGEVLPGEAAWEAGLQQGDRIKKVNGKDIYSFENMGIEVALAGGRPAKLLVQRGEELLEALVEPRYMASSGLRGMGAGPMFNEDSFVAKVDDKNSQAHKAGLRTGDLLKSINGISLQNQTALSLLNELNTFQPDTQVSVEFYRAGKPQEVSYQATKNSSFLIGVRPAEISVLGLQQDFEPIQELEIQRGDTILFLGQQRFVGGKLEFPPGSSKVQLTVLREGETDPLVLSAQVTAEELAALPEKVVLTSLDIDVAYSKPGVLVVPQKDSPAAKAGIISGSRILHINGQAISTWKDLQTAVKAAKGTSMKISLLRGEELISIDLLPQQYHLRDFSINYEPLKEPYQIEGFGPSLKAGLVCSLDLCKQLYVTLKRIFTGEVSAKNLGGIITISRVTYNKAQSGWASLFYFLALLSVNLAFVNVLPIPVLDGGHLMFLLIERIKGSPVSASVHNYSQILGLAFVLGLLVFVTYNDILRLF